MIHMRPYNAFETKNVKFLVDKQISFTTIQITGTGLKKNILDATAPVRAYFKENGIHNYEHQLQGTEHKRLIDTYVLTEASSHLTKTSLYRPVTKKGDPRLWVNKVKGVDFLRENDIFALIAHNHILYAVNLNSIDIPKVFSSRIDTPLKDLIIHISRAKSSTSEELLGLIRDRMTDWMPAEILADTGIGRTVESVLGIPMNDSKEPDFKGIELKSHRASSKVRNALFTQTPDWSISRLKKGSETFWTNLETMVHDGHEYFRCSEIEHTKNPITPQFDILLDQGQITVDMLLCRPSGHGDTYSFKIKKNARALLFPKSDIYRFEH